MSSPRPGPRKARKRVLPILLVMSFAITASGAGARARNPIFYGCRNQTVGIEMTRSQAQSYLPEGFEPSVGAASQEAVVHFYVSTLVCGRNISTPDLELATTYLSVRPPEDYKSKSPRTVHYFLLDGVISGSEASRLQRYLCADAFLSEGTIDSNQQMDTTDASISRGTSAVDSETLSFRLSVVDSGAASSGAGSIRWIYEQGGRIRHFDYAIYRHYLSVGTGHVQFTAPYRDLPPAAPGPSFYNLEDISFTAPIGCRS